MPNTPIKPYLSIVTVSRNDNHGGDMMKRMRLFVKGLIHQCNKFKLPCELVMVEWNPIAGVGLLKDVLPQTQADDFLSIRYVLVPNEVHKKHAFSDQIPLFQMIGKNVGIRRAYANFVLCTNVDLLFSDELFEILSKKELKEGHYYRANRCDVPNTLDEGWDFGQQIKFCKENIKKRLGKNALFPNFADTRGVLFKYATFYPLLKFLSGIKATFYKSAKARLQELDMDACGDFTLMSKKDWLSIQGYPELEIYSIHIDSMGIIAASAQGIKQVILPGDACTYHMEHSSGWEFATPIEKIHFYTKKPMLDWSSVHESGLYLLENNLKYNLNREEWGLNNLKLQEI